MTNKIDKIEIDLIEQFDLAEKRQERLCITTALILTLRKNW